MRKKPWVIFHPIVLQRICFIMLSQGFNSLELFNWKLVKVSANLIRMTFLRISKIFLRMDLFLT